MENMPNLKLYLIHKDFLFLTLDVCRAEEIVLSDTAWHEFTEKPKARVVAATHIFCWKFKVN